MSAILILVAVWGGLIVGALCALIGMWGARR